MKRRGFTLVELLAVIVILAIILTIAVPSVVRIKNKIKADAWERQKDLILDAAKKHITMNGIMPAEGETYTIILANLIEADLVSASIKSPITNELLDSNMEIVILKNEGNYKFTYESLIEESMRKAIIYNEGKYGKYGELVQTPLNDNFVLFYAWIFNLKDPSYFVSLSENEEYLSIVFENENDLKGTMYETEIAIDIEKYNTVHLEYSINNQPRQVISDSLYSPLTDMPKIYVVSFLYGNESTGKLVANLEASPDPVDGRGALLRLEDAELKGMFPLEFRIHKIWLE